MVDISASSESMALASLKTKIIAAPEQMARLRAGLKPTDCFFWGDLQENIKKPCFFSCFFFHVFFMISMNSGSFHPGVMGSLDRLETCSVSLAAKGHPPPRFGKKVTTGEINA